MVKKLYNKVESVMMDEGENNFFSFESFLYLISIFFNILARCRLLLYKKGIFKIKTLFCDEPNNIKVISIGNLTVGGTGKTPMTIHVARLLKNHGLKVVILSRGYKGSVSKKGEVICDGASVIMEPHRSGDEPYMIAQDLKNVPLIAGRDRYKAGMMAIKRFNPDVIVLDDAFQHLKVARDINIVLLDARRPLGNAHILPRGTLRESPEVLERAHVIVFTHGEPKNLMALKGQIKSLQSIPLFTSTHNPFIYKIIKKDKGPSKTSTDLKDPSTLKWLREKQIFAFSGIARNVDFINTLKGLKCDIVGFSEFSDHHQYADSDLDEIFNLAKTKNANLLATTQKDYARLTQKHKWSFDLLVLGIEISFQDHEFNDFILNHI